jgi:hypothetical protein
MNGPERSPEEIQAVLKELLELQVLDAEIIQLGQQLGVLAPKLAALEEKLARERKAFEAAEGPVFDGHVERQRIEKEIHGIEQSIEEHRKRQIGLKTNKEYAAVEHEIAAMRRRIDQLETRILQIIEQEEGTSRAQSEAHKRFDRFRAEAEEEKQRIGQQIRTKKERLEKRTAERDAWRRRIPPDVLRLYDRLSERHPGTVVVMAVQNSCGGCHMNLVHQKMLEIRQMQRFVRCDGCLRLFAGEAKNE